MRDKNEGALTAAPAAFDRQWRVTVVGSAAARAVTAYARLPPPACRHNMQSETEALGRIDHNSRAVGGNGRAKHERHGARSRHTQTGGNGKAAALGVSLSDVAAGKIRKREQKRVKGLRP